ncbi:MAG TPA: TIGR01777 family oxidoreductase [Anaeromyxobacteraceae bacterium]|nr:TIGR01777 family oxidoreductase [Anaeromyxobacteraceae bacterium]
MHVFLTGATGLIGRALLMPLLARGHVVTALSRTASPRLVPGVRVIQGDPAVAGRWQDALAACDACIHLAGEPVAAARWNDARKRAIRESRVASTARIAEVLAARGPSVLLSGSAVGFYGSRGHEVLDEASPAGDGFLADVCQAWEAAARPAEARARVVLLRTGIVLARQGGALRQMLLPFKLFAGGPLGKGDFWQAWIHLGDEVGLILWALENEAVRGPLDLTAPAPALQRDLAAAIGRALGRPSALPVPVAALKLALGELATVVLASQRVLPRKAQELGYGFRYPALQAALDDLLRRR